MFICTVSSLRRIFHGTRSGVPADGCVHCAKILTQWRGIQAVVEEGNRPGRCRGRIECHISQRP